MKTKTITLIALLCILVSACSKETPASDEKKTPKPVVKSALTMLCHEWVLSETYYDDELKTSNGTDKYRFEKNGSFWFKDKGTWKNIGTFTYFSKDSTAIVMDFGGGSTEFVWFLQKLNENELQTEFSAGGRKLNYNYTR